MKDSVGYKIIYEWLTLKGLKPFAYQEETWQHISEGRSGLVNAPTGTGKTFSVFLGSIINFINEHPKIYRTKKKNGLQLLWVTPLRALAKDIGRAMQEVIDELGMQWKVGIRNSDTSSSERQKQKTELPEVLIITPESLHILLSQKGYPQLFEHLKIIAVDEWHELMGIKRGVQVELAISRIVAIKNSECSISNSQFSIWGISATIGNLEEAKDVLLSPLAQLCLTEKSNHNSDFQASEVSALVASPVGGSRKGAVIVSSRMKKQIVIESIIPDEIETYPWAGHLGIKLVHKVIPIIRDNKTTLIFINTRGMSENWYHAILNAAPDLAGSIALHHGSIDMELRTWIEEAIHEEKLKAVVCTSSLDLGVDFRPVETVVQVGSPKGVARFLQRAGRSGHSPDAISKIYFLPTHSLELVEAAALKTAIEKGNIESREPITLCYDVLIQYLCTLAVSEGFLPEQIFKEVTSTFCYRDLSEDEWKQILYFITQGGNSLQQYDDFKKVEVENGVYKIVSRRMAMRHRLNIGTIVGNTMMKVKYLAGGYIGNIEEWFISRLNPGDVFTLGGKTLELIMIKDMTALVKKSSAKRAITPSWKGDRLPLSASLGKTLREKFNEAFAEADKEVSNSPDIEIRVLHSLLRLQQQLSHIPRSNELLMEHIEDSDGFHLYVFPFEGRLVHEAMAAILAYRIGKLIPITFSIAMNDYGFELLSDQPVPVDDSNVYELFSPDDLIADIQRSVSATEMAKRKFRDIAVIGGLIFTGFPGEQKKSRHLQASASLLFNVFSEFEPGNVLLRQAYQEVFDQQMEEVRLRDMLNRIQHSKIVITYPKQLTPFCFPIKVDYLRENLTTEKLEDRVRRMQQQLSDC